jgi:hypothetical protein
MPERKTTSIKVNPQLWKEFKKQAIDYDKDLSDLLEDLIRKHLKERPNRND